MTYGAELLRYKARQPFISLDQRVVKLFLTKLLKLGKERPLSVKHQFMVQLALGLGTYQMAVDDIVRGRIGTWIARRADKEEVIALRANKSIFYILKLPRDHPLRFELAKARPTIRTPIEKKQEAWVKLRDNSKGTSPNPLDRQILASNTVLSKADGPSLESFVETPVMNGELRKAA